MPKLNTWTVANTFLNVCEKIHLFLSSIKKDAHKRILVPFFCLTVSMQPVTCQQNVALKTLISLLLSSELHILMYKWVLNSSLLQKNNDYDTITKLSQILPTSRICGAITFHDKMNKHSAFQLRKKERPAGITGRCARGLKTSKYSRRRHRNVRSTLL